MASRCCCNMAPRWLLCTALSSFTLTRAQHVDSNSPREAQNLSNLSAKVCVGRSTKCAVYIDVPYSCNTTTSTKSHCPIVFALHSAGGYATDFLDTIGPLCHSNKVVCVYPQSEEYGNGTQWNDGNRWGNRCSYRQFEHCPLDPNEGEFFVSIIKDGEAAQANGAAEIENLKQVSKEAFAASMQKVLDLSIDGYPKALRSTMAKRNEMLRETAGNQDAACEKIKAQAAALSEEAKTWLLGLVPYVGLPFSVLYPTWRLMRRVCLLAGVMGLDLTAEDTRGRILHVFAGLRAVPAGEYALEQVVQLAWTAFAGPAAAFIPVGMLTSKVVNMEGIVMSQIGEETFSEKKQVVPESEYTQLLDPEPTAADYLSLAKEGTAAALMNAWSTLTEKQKREQMIESGKQTGIAAAQTAIRIGEAARAAGSVLGASAVSKLKEKTSQMQTRDTRGDCV